MEIQLTLQRSEHADDRRLAEPTDLTVDVLAIPREGELLDLPWPLRAQQPTARVTAVVDLVEHVWIEGDLPTPHGPIPVLRVRVVANLLEPDISDGPWE